MGAGSIEASYEGDFFFEKDKGFDWVWETLYVDGVKWRGKKLESVIPGQPKPGGDQAEALVGGEAIDGQ